MNDANTTAGPPARDRGRQRKALVFCHIYKTAGTTLDDIIERHFDKEAILYIPEWDSQKTEGFMERLENLAPDERLRYRCVLGTPFFGVHKYLASPCMYFTLLRPPVRRVISEYYHHVNSRKADGREIPPGYETLEDFLKSGMMLARNGQVRQLQGISAGAWPDYGPVKVSQDDLATAMANLREHFIVGLTERFDESLILLKRALGWKLADVIYIRLREGKHPPVSSFSQETIRLIEEHNELDLKLYEFARQLFDEQISRQDSSFAREVKTLRLLNKFPFWFTIRASLLLVSLIRGKLKFTDLCRIVRIFTRMMRSKLLP